MFAPPEDITTFKQKLLNDPQKKSYLIALLIQNQLDRFNRLIIKLDDFRELYSVCEGTQKTDALQLFLRNNNVTHEQCRKLITLFYEDNDSTTLSEFDKIFPPLIDQHKSLTTEEKENLHSTLKTAQLAKATYAITIPPSPKSRL